MRQSWRNALADGGGGGVVWDMEIYLVTAYETDV